jgi:hypothetical protein
MIYWDSNKAPHEISKSFAKAVRPETSQWVELRKNGKIDPEMSYCSAICSTIYGPKRATLRIFVMLNNIGIYYSDARYRCFTTIPMIFWGGLGYRIAQLVNLS